MLTRKNINLLGAILLLAITFAIALIDPVNFYDARYGRNLNFTGVSKWLLASGWLLFAIAAYIKHRDVNKGYELAVDLNYHLIPFMVGCLVIIFAFVVETQLF